MDDKLERRPTWVINNIDDEESVVGYFVHIKMNLFDKLHQVYLLSDFTLLYKGVVAMHNVGQKTTNSSTNERKSI